MTTFNDETMSHAENVLQQVHEDWLHRPGVTAVDLGFKWTDGQMTDQLAIRVHVREKRPLAELGESEKFPKEIEGVPIDVIEAQYGLQIAAPFVALESASDNRQQRFAEVPLGVSVGSPHVTAGTLGAKVFDAETGETMILSNWHVLAGIPTATAGLPVWQPGPADGGRNNDNAIAVLSRFVLGPHDAAVARITGQRPILDETLEGDTIEDVIPPRLGMTLWKSGRTTGFTAGFIDGVHMTVVLNYGAAGQRALRDVIHIVPVPGAGPVEISAGGDSGSVWVDQSSGKAVGLHFAGEVGDTPEHALANDIVQVAAHLGIHFPAQAAPPLEEDSPVAVDEPPVDEPPTAVTPSPDPAPAPDPTPVPVKPPTLSFWQRLIQWLRNLFGR